MAEKTSVFTGVLVPGWHDHVRIFLAVDAEGLTFDFQGHEHPFRHLGESHERDVEVLKRK